MNIKKYWNVSQKLTVCIENEEKEDIVIIFADPSVKVIQNNFHIMNQQLFKAIIMFEQEAHS